MLEQNFEKLKAKAKQDEISLARAMKLEEAEFLKNRVQYIKEATDQK